MLKVFHCFFRVSSLIDRKTKKHYIASWLEQHSKCFSTKRFVEMIETSRSRYFACVLNFSICFNEIINAIPGQLSFSEFFLDNINPNSWKQHVDLCWILFGAQVFKRSQHYPTCWIITRANILVCDHWTQWGWRYHHTKQSMTDRKSTRLNSSHANISYAVFCLKKKKK